MTVVESPVAGCDLCEAVPFTRQYFADELCWVAECESCGVPMVVWRPHGTEPDEQTLAHMLAALGRAAQECFGPDGRWFLDRHMRQIPDHFHAHARPDRWNVPRVERPAADQ